MKKYINSFFTLFSFSVLIILFLSCNNRSDKKSNWRLIYKNDNKGNTIYGNKRDLLNAVRDGYPIRLGFGGRLKSDSTMTIEHISDAGFLTILNNEDVYAQISQIIGQNPLMEKDSTNVAFRKNTRWSIVLGTNGFSDRLTVSFNNDTILGNNQKNMWISWFINTAKPIENTIPLWDKN